jgi:hypothetical protein
VPSVSWEAVKVCAKGLVVHHVVQDDESILHVHADGSTCDHALGPNLPQVLTAEEGVSTRTETTATETPSSTQGSPPAAPSSASSEESPSSS